MDNDRASTSVEWLTRRMTKDRQGQYLVAVVTARCGRCADGSKSCAGVCTRDAVQVWACGAGAFE